MRYLGIDYGMKRVGLALSDEAGNFAYPHSVIRNDKNLLKNVRELCEKEKVKKIVLGESLDYKNEPNKLMAEINIFKRNIEEILKMNVYFQTETLSSAEAERIQGKVEKLDASAAAIILQNYIDSKKHRK